MTNDVGVYISTSEPIPTTAKPHESPKSSAMISQHYVTTDDTPEATTDTGMDINATTSEFINRYNDSVNQSNIDATAAVDTSKIARNWIKYSEGESTTYGHLQTTMEPVTDMEVHITSNYYLEETQALVEDQMDNVTVMFQETTPSAHLLTETIVNATLIYFTDEESTTRPQDQNITGTYTS